MTNNGNNIPETHGFLLGFRAGKAFAQATKDATPFLRNLVQHDPGALTTEHGARAALTICYGVSGVLEYFERLEHDEREIRALVRCEQRLKALTRNPHLISPEHMVHALGRGIDRFDHVVSYYHGNGVA